MLSSVANLIQIQQGPAAFRTAFAAHLRVQRVRVADTKAAPSTAVPVADLHEAAFYTPPRTVGSALIIDIDRPEAVLEIFDTLPPEIHPSWVVETPSGAQAGWMIDPVDLRTTGRDHPKRYAWATGTALRTALNADPAVDPLTPAKVRNPAYQQAETRAAATPPVYTLRQIHHHLAAAGLWNPETTTTHQLSSAQRARAAQPAAIVEEGSRNVAIFDEARYIAYDGGDYEAAAWAANERCINPLPAAEVAGIIRSISRYIARGPRRRPTNATTAMPESMREALADLGRAGGSRNTPAQRAARAQGPLAAAAARRKQADHRAHRAQRMRAQGHTQADIAAALGVHRSTVCRLLRRWIQLPTLRCSTGASGVPCGPREVWRVSRRVAHGHLPRCALRRHQHTVPLWPPKRT